MNHSSTQEEECLTHLNGNSSDFFEGLFQNRASKVASICFSITVACTILPLLYGIVWFEKNGSDQKRTMINKFVTSFCLTFFEWFFIIQTIDTLRYMHGPLPEFICTAQITLKNSIYAQILLFLNGILISKYIFIFWLKNPAAFNDDFWSLFVNIWVVSFSILTHHYYLAALPYTIIFALERTLSLTKIYLLRVEVNCTS